MFYSGCNIRLSHQIVFTFQWPVAICWYILPIAKQDYNISIFFSLSVLLPNISLSKEWGKRVMQIMVHRVLHVDKWFFPWNLPWMPVCLARWCSFGLFEVKIWDLYCVGFGSQSSIALEQGTHLFSLLTMPRLLEIFLLLYFSAKKIFISGNVLFSSN